MRSRAVPVLARAAGLSVLSPFGPRDFALNFFLSSAFIEGLRSASFLVLRPWLL